MLPKIVVAHFTATSGLDAAVVVGNFNTVTVVACTLHKKVGMAVCRMSKQEQKVTKLSLHSSFIL